MCSYFLFVFLDTSVNSELCVKNRVSKISISSDENSEKGSVRHLKVKQMSIPEYCLDMMECVFCYLQQKSGKLDESNMNINKKQVSFNLCFLRTIKLVS